MENNYKQHTSWYIILVYLHKKVFNLYNNTSKHDKII